MNDHEHYFELAAAQARRATCHRAKCGSVIVTSDGHVIGAGFNAPPRHLESMRYCDAKLDMTKKPSYDKTCCVHAEWNAIMGALKDYGEKVNGARLYFMRVDEDGAWTDAGEPFCTVCSRLALESGLDEFALWVDGAPKIYDTTRYNADTYKMYQTEGVS